MLRANDTRSAWCQRPSSLSLLRRAITAASPTHTPTGADYRPSSSLLSPTDATTDEEEDASAPSSASGRPPSASGEDVDSSIGAAWTGRYWTAASARRRGGGRRACRAATRVATLSIALFFCRFLGLPAASRGPLQSVRPQRPRVQQACGTATGWDNVLRAVASMARCQSALQSTASAG